MIPYSVNRLFFTALMVMSFSLVPMVGTAEQSEKLAPKVDAAPIGTPPLVDPPTTPDHTSASQSKTHDKGLFLSSSDQQRYDDYRANTSDPISPQLWAYQKNEESNVLFGLEIASGLLTTGLFIAANQPSPPNDMGMEKLGFALLGLASGTVFLTLCIIDAMDIGLVELKRPTSRVSRSSDSFLSLAPLVTRSSNGAAAIGWGALGGGTF